MKQDNTSTPVLGLGKQKKVSVNRLVYLAFTLIGILYFIFLMPKALGAAFLGLALIFDPFQQDKAFQQRPRWQQVWLLVHAAAVYGVFLYVFLK